ncbi:hypothetical protein OIU76_026692 [Salix suchowensis]|nr:hypothetical protein OIU76_026692 [Salix suchowensis]
MSLEKERLNNNNNVAKIKVVVRKRPLNKKEMSRKEEDIITIESNSNSNSLTVHETKLKVDLTEYVEKHEFVFDAVLKEGVSNDEVYSQTVQPIVPLIFQRTKATCFAYGQTGSGKTYTMQPLPLKASQDILRLMHHTYWNQGFQLFVSFFEIYGGKLFDLLNDRKKLCMREDGKQQVCIVGLQEYRVSDVEAIREFIEKGNATRSTGITDLAGSERGADTTDNDKQTRIEGAEINKSLLALKECIRALDSDQGHIPFPRHSGSCEHTLNTLRYADRVKSLSKGNSTKRDPLSSSNLRDSTTLPLTSFSQLEPTFVDSIADFPNEKSRFGWSRPTERETSPPFNMDRVPSGRIEGNLPASVHTDYYKVQSGGQSVIIANDCNYTEESYEIEKPSWMNNNKKVDTFQKSALEDKRRTDSLMKQRDVLAVQAINSHSDDELNVLLKEEEDLVSVHRKQVEETIDIVREEMDLLAEADQPGNQLDEYISKLNAILSQKAEGILQLQTRLAQFQKLMNEYNVLVS